MRKIKFFKKFSIPGNTREKTGWTTDVSRQGNVFDDDVGIVLDQLALSLFPLQLKLPIGIALRKKGLVMEHLPKFHGSLHGWFLAGVDGEIDEFFPNVTHGLVGRMDHVLLVKAIVTKLVEKDFVGGQIVDIGIGLANGWKFFAEDFSNNSGQLCRQ